MYMSLIGGGIIPDIISVCIIQHDNYGWARTLYKQKQKKGYFVKCNM